MASNIQQQGDIFDAIADSSYAIEWLQQIFPFFGGDVSTMLASGAWSDTMLAFNMAILTIAAMFFGWNVSSGFIDAARDGRPFADKVHLAWGPMRAFGGLGLVAPIPGIGWSLGQGLVLFLAVMASSFATHVWSTTVNAVFPTDGDAAEIRNMTDQKSVGDDSRMGVNALMGPIPSNAAPDFVKSILEKELCYANLKQQTGLNQSVLKGKGANGDWWEYLFSSAADLDSPIASSQPSPMGRPIERDGTTHYVWDYGPVCGAVEVEKRPVLTQKEWQQGYAGLPLIGVGGSDDVAYEEAKTAMEARQQFDETRRQVVANTITRLRGNGTGSPYVVGGKLASIPGADYDLDIVQKLAGIHQGASGELSAKTIGAQMQNIQKAASTEMVNAARSYLRSRAAKAISNFSDYSEKRGWASAGVTFLAVANVNTQAAQAASNGPSVDNVKFDLLKKEHRQDIQKVFGVSSGLASFGQRANAMDGGDVKQLMSMDQVLWGDGTLFSYLTDWIRQGIKGAGDLENTTNPYGGMIMFGHEMLNTAAYWLEWLMGLLGGAGVASVFIPTSDLGKATTAAIITLGPLIIFHGILGVLHGYILPFLPYLYWIFGVVAFVFSLIEAIFAIPFWGVMSAKLEGDELFHQGQKTGLMLMFGVFLRPVLMILGLVAGFAAFSIIAKFLNQTWEIATDVAMYGDAGIIGALIGLAIITYLYWYTATRCLSLIHKLPAKVGNWMGVSIDSGQEDEGDSRAVYGVVGGYAASAGKTAASGGAMNATAKAGGAAASKMGAAAKPSTRISSNDQQ